MFIFSGHLAIITILVAVVLFASSAPVGDALSRSLD